MENTIILINDTHVWEAYFSGPHAAEIESLFGTTLIPTPFSSSTSADVVRAAIQARNPGVFVQFA